MLLRYCITPLVLATAALPAHAQTYPDIVETSEDAQALIAAEEAYLPDGDWRLRRSLDGCSVRRDFTLGEEHVSLTLRRLQPGMPIQYALMGSEFTGEEQIDAGFVPGSGLAQYTRLVFASMGEREGFVFAGQPFPVPQGETRPDERALGTLTEYFVVQGDEADPIVLRTGPVNPALNALAQCSTDNLTELGVDTRGLGSLLRRASLQNTDEIGAHLQAAYPGNARRDGQQGPVLTRVIVDSSGQVTHCHVASYMTARRLREAACETLRDHGVFEPALNFRGEPTTDFFVMNVIFYLSGLR